MMRFLKKWGPALLIGLLCLAGGLAAFAYRQDIYNIISSQAARDEFIAWVQSKGVWGVLTFLGLQVLQVVVAVLPGEPVELMAGALFGAFGGLVICLVGILIGSMFIYTLMKAFGAHAVPKEALAKYRFLQDEARVRGALYLLFFLPGTPKDMLTYVGPFLPVSQLEFFVVCTLARLPSVITSTIAGASLADGVLWLPVVIFLATGAAGLACIRYEEKILAWLRLHRPRKRQK